MQKNYFDVDAKGWKLIRFGFGSCAMWAVSNFLLMFSYWVHWYLYNANKERTIIAKKGKDFFDAGVETRPRDFHRRPNNPLV